MGSTSGHGGTSYDFSFKILLIGDSGVGKSSLLVSFIAGSVDDLPPTIGKHVLDSQFVLIQFWLYSNYMLDQ